MDKRTLVYCLSLLDTQRTHMLEGGPESVRIQTAYYDGMRRMLEAIISEAYSENMYVVRENGKHTILA